MFCYRKECRVLRRSTFQAPRTPRARAAPLGNLVLCILTISTSSYESWLASVKSWRPAYQNHIWGDTCGWDPLEWRVAAQSGMRLRDKRRVREPATATGPRGSVRLPASRTRSISRSEWFNSTQYTQSCSQWLAVSLADRGVATADRRRVTSVLQKVGASRL